MTIVTYPDFLQTQTYSAAKLRYQQEDLTPNGEGVIGGRDALRVSQRGAGANMSVDIAAGSGYVRADSGTRNGMYHVVNDAVVNAAIGANASGNPRIDRVYLQIADSSDLGSGTDVSTMVVLAGTPTGGATLDNLSGAGAIPNSALHLADVLVANGAANIVDANIRTRRAYGKQVIPPLITDIDMVQFQKVFNHSTERVGGAVGNPSHTDIFSSHTVTTTGQGAALAYLPRRIVGATRVRFGYGQSSTTAQGGNFVIAIFDASGRLIIDTGAVAFAGAINTQQSVSAAITATTFEAGMYYVFCGLNTSAGASFAVAGTLLSSQYDNTGSMAGPIVNSPNVALRAAAGGTTVPTTLLGLTDLFTTTGIVPGVPQIALSVG